MNYIKKLEAQVAIYETAVAEIRRYMALDKFNWPNNKVNVADIHLRLRDWVDIPMGDLEAYGEDAELPGQPRYSQEQLEAAFNKVADSEDWKAPIYKALPADEVDQELVGAAVQHFTATTASFQTMRSGRVLVQAEGYRMGPAGDH